VRRDLPALLDILRVSIEAGGSLAAALRAGGGRAEGPLATEWGAVAKEVGLGVPLERALEGLAVRLPQPEGRAFASPLRRAGRHRPPRCPPRAPAPPPGPPPPPGGGGAGRAPPPPPPPAASGKTPPGRARRSSWWS